jgi:hypothetical protein
VTSVPVPHVHTVVIAFDAPAAEADALARSLAAWFDDDEDLTGSTRLRMVPPAPGEQGGLADAAEVLGAVGPALEALAGGLFVWLTGRVKTGRVTLEVTRQDGASVKLSAGSAEDAAVL